MHGFPFPVTFFAFLIRGCRANISVTTFMWFRSLGITSCMHWSCAFYFTVITFLSHLIRVKTGMEERRTHCFWQMVLPQLRAAVCLLSADTGHWQTTSIYKRVTWSSYGHRHRLTSTLHGIQIDGGNNTRTCENIQRQKLRINRFFNLLVTWWHHSHQRRMSVWCMR